MHQLTNLVFTPGGSRSQTSGTLDDHGDFRGDDLEEYLCTEN